MVRFLNKIKKNIKENKSMDHLDELYTYIKNRWNEKNVFCDDVSKEVMEQVEMLETVMKLQRKEVSKSLAEKLVRTVDTKKLAYTNFPKRAYEIYTLKDNKETILIGDLHSDPESLVAILKEIQFIKKASLNQCQLVFLGDYVDRGKGHFEMMDLLLSVKILFPKHVILLRGNHDGGYIDKRENVDTQYRIMDFEDKNIYFPHFIRSVEYNPYILTKLLPHYLAFFESLAYIAFIKSKDGIYMACHAGLPRPILEDEDQFSYITSLRDLTDVRIKDIIERPITSNLFWSDPIEGDLVRWDNGRFSFNQEIFEAFKNNFFVDKIFRGHVAEESGINEHFDKQVITVYSTGGKLKDKTNEMTAYPNVTPQIAVLNRGEIEYKYF